MDSHPVVPRGLRESRTLPSRPVRQESRFRLLRRELLHDDFDRALFWARCVHNPWPAKWQVFCGSDPKVLATCKLKKSPLEKIAIGVGLYYQVGQSQGLITAENILDLDKALGRKLLGAGAWDINFVFDDPRSKPFFSTLAAPWSGSQLPPSPTPPTPPPAPPTPPTPPAPPTPPPGPCSSEWQQCGALVKEMCLI